MSTVCLPTELLHVNAMAQSAALLGSLRQSGGAWALDASTLRDFDSSALSVLLQLQREASRAGQSLIIASAPAKLRELAALYGVAELLAPQPA